MINVFLSYKIPHCCLMKLYLRTIQFKLSSTEEVPCILCITLGANMVKGQRARKANKSYGFKKGNRCFGLVSTYPAPQEPSKVKYMRLCRDQHSLVANDADQVTARDVRGAVCDVKLPRPRPAKETDLDCAADCTLDQCNEKKTVRLIQLQKCEDLWNTAIVGHRDHAALCHGRLEFDMASERQIGAAGRRG